MIHKLPASCGGYRRLWSFWHPLFSRLGHPLSSVATCASFVIAVVYGLHNRRQATKLQRDCIDTAQVVIEDVYVICDDCAWPKKTRIAMDRQHPKDMGV